MHHFASLRACAAALALLILLTMPGHAQVATPEETAPESQTLLNAAMDTLPSGRAIVAVDRWRLSISPEPMTFPAFHGPIVITVESGEVRASDASGERNLGAGDWQSFSGETAFSLQPVGAADAIFFIVYMIPSFQDAFSDGEGFEGYDPTAYTVEFLISTSADDLPGGPGRIVLERLTLPTGSALPTMESQPLVWTEVGAGALGLALEGERLPFRWKSGAERTFRPGQYLPALADGVQMTFRNVGTNELILYRLSIVPEAT